MERTVHRGIADTTTGKKESFTDLHFADDVALLAEMLSVLVLALEVINVEARPLGLTINWAKTKIQYFDDPDGVPRCATVQGHQVEVVESFIQLGSLIHSSGSSEPEIRRRAYVHEAMFVLDQNILRSNISLQTKLRLYNTSILLIYWAETWSVTATLSRKIDSLDNWCLRRILNIHWTEFVTNDELRCRTGQPLSVRHCPESSSVLRWSSQPSGSMPGPLPSSAGLHCGHSCRLETKAWPSQTIVAQNGGDRPASTESWPGDGKATHAGHSGMAATRGNGNVDHDKLMNEEAHHETSLLR